MSPAARTDHCRDLDAPLRWALAVVAMGAAFLHFAVIWGIFSGEHPELGANAAS